VARRVVPELVERMAGSETCDEPDPAQREDDDRGLQRERDDDDAQARARGEPQSDGELPALLVGQAIAPGW
jgi:hypothetical protein